MVFREQLRTTVLHSANARQVSDQLRCDPLAVRSREAEVLALGQLWCESMAVGSWALGGRGLVVFNSALPTTVTTKTPGR